MGLAGGVGPGGAGVVVALRADIDIGIVIIGERAAGRNVIIGHGLERIAELGKVGGGLMRVVAGDADDGDIRIADGQGGAFQKTDAN